MALTRTAIFGPTGVIVLAQDVDTLMPPSGGVTVSAAGNWKSLEIVIGLSTADKLAAVGTKTLSVWSAYSLDSGATWKPINRIDWKSYGPGGVTVTDPTGVQWVNRDPTFTVPLNGRTGHMVRLGYRAHGIAQSTGIVVNGVK